MLDIKYTGIVSVNGEVCGVFGHNEEHVVERILQLGISAGSGTPAALYEIPEHLRSDEDPFYGLTGLPWGTVGDYEMKKSIVAHTVKDCTRIKTIVM